MVYVDQPKCLFKFAYRIPDRDWVLDPAACAACDACYWTEHRSQNRPRQAVYQFCLPFRPSASLTAATDFDFCRSARWLQRLSCLLFMLKRYSLRWIVLLALLSQVFANTERVSRQLSGPLRVAFAPHPFLSHWAVSAPIAHELLQRGHLALVRFEVLVSELVTHSRNGSSDCQI